MRYTRCDVNWWHEVGECSPEARLVGAYYRSNPHCNLTGCYALPVVYIADHTGLSPQKIQAAEAELTTLGWLIRAGRWVFWARHLTDNKLTSPAAHGAAVKVLQGLPDSPARLACVSALLSQTGFGTYEREALEQLTLGNPYSGQVDGNGGTQEGGCDPTSDPPGEGGPDYVSVSESVSVSASETDLDQRQVAAWRRVWEAWRAHHPRSSLEPNALRRKRIEEALARKVSPETTALQDALDAVEGNHIDPHCCGQNKTGTEYHDIELILRDDAHIERYAHIWRNRGAAPKGAPLSTREARSRAAAERALQEWESET